MRGLIAAATGLCALFAVLFLISFRRGLREERKALARNEPLRPGLRAQIDISGTYGILAALATLLFGAALAAGADGWWKLGPLIVVNTIIQPLSLYLVVVGMLTLWHTLRGRLVYALRPIPEEAIPPGKRRFVFIHRVVSGIVTVVIGCTLSRGCMAPLL